MNMSIDAAIQHLSRLALFGMSVRQSGSGNIPSHKQVIEG
jgi:hypothetical protein